MYVINIELLCNVLQCCDNNNNCCDADQLTDVHSECEKDDHISPMEILVVIDGTWTNYEGRKLVAYVFNYISNYTL